MQKTILTLFILTSLLLANSAYAEEVCLKGYGNTPAEAFKAGAKLLNNTDAEMGKGWMKDNMQIRIQPKKEKGLFVAEVFSIYNNKRCGSQLSPKTADTDRPKCETDICSI
jgi:hypothetical protein